MDWKILFSTFGALFLAELGDKTQLATIMMASKTQKPVTVFLGASLALVLVTLIGVAFAAVITQYVNVEILKKVASAGFVVLGVLMYFDVI